MLSVVKVTYAVGVCCEITGWVLGTLVLAGVQGVGSHLGIVDVPSASIRQKFCLTGI